MSTLTIVHLSDLHFGKDHRFQPGIAVDGDRLTDENLFSLRDSLAQDWRDRADELIDESPVVVAITGDLTCAAEVGEFKLAERFVGDLSGILDATLGPERVFVVPGNHDVDWARDDHRGRMSEYLAWYTKVFGFRLTPNEHRKLNRVRTVTLADSHVVVAELNSSLYVEKGTPGSKRGRVDEQALIELENQVRAIEEGRLSRSFRILLLHHHAVLVPEFAEPGRGYDAVENGTALMRFVERYKFHLVLHGHKHFPRSGPHVPGSFGQQSKWQTLISAGGSAGACHSQLPTNFPGATNTYSTIRLESEDLSTHCNVELRTHGLQLNDDAAPLLTRQMTWRTLNHQTFFSGQPRPREQKPRPGRPRAEGADGAAVSIADVSDAVGNIKNHLSSAEELAKRNDGFAFALMQTLSSWWFVAADWSKGEVRLSDSHATNVVVCELYRRARRSVFSTCARQYLEQWNTPHGDDILAAHQVSSAKVTRVFLFNTRADIDERALEIFRRQADVGIDVRIFINSETAFNFPPEISQDFTYIDDGAAIGVTTAFTAAFTGEPQTQAVWYFENVHRRLSYQRMIGGLTAADVLTYGQFLMRHP